MENLNSKIGYWVTLLQSIVGYLWAIFYITFLFLFPPGPWTGLADYALQYTGLYKILLIFGQILAFSQSLLYLVIALVLKKRTSPEKEIFANFGVATAGIFLTLSSIHYYIQWTTVHQGLTNGILEGLEYFVQLNFYGPISAINMLGWTFFFGISNLSFSFCFEKNKRGKWIAYGFRINGILCILTSVIFALGVEIILGVWAISLCLTWYVYILMAHSFRKGTDTIAKNPFTI